MFKSRLKTIAEKLCNVKCEYSSTCKRFNAESETCTKALDKRYCGEFKRIEARNNT
jgi:hypothetical protein